MTHKKSGQGRPLTHATLSQGVNQRNMMMIPYLDHSFKHSFLLIVDTPNFLGVLNGRSIN